jgi:hypothetical protein
MQKQEKLDKDLVLRVYPSLFKKFRKTCKDNYKKVSEVMRELMVEYIQRNEKKVEGS